MSKYRNLVAVCLVAVFALGNDALAQDKKPAAETKPAATKPAAETKPAADAKAAGQPSPEEMAKFMQAAAPGDAHGKLKPLAGKWTTVTKWRMAPDQPWGESKGKAENKWIMGDRFLVQDYKGEPDPSMGGMSFEGHGMSGYDNVSKKYWSTWLDNMGTGIMLSEGVADGSGKTFTYNSHFNCPMTGGKKEVRSVTKIEGDDKYVFQMFDKAPDGKEFMSLEVSYTRVK